MTAPLNRPRELLRADLAHRTGADVRAAARAGGWSRATHGLARSHLQANLAIVRERRRSRAHRHRGPEPYGLGKYNPLSDDNVAVYWACGVTPGHCEAHPRDDHACGHMFVTDLKLGAAT